MINMEDIAQKVTERLYGEDKVKFEIILTMLYYAQKFGVIGYYSEGNVDEYIRGIIEHLEDNTDLEKLDHKHVRERDIPINDWKKVTEILEDENLDFENKNSSKEFFKRFVKRMDS